MWESRRLWARFPRDSWKEWEACLWLSTLSTVLPFPQLSFLLSKAGFQGLRVLCVAMRAGIFFLLAVFQTVTFAVHLQDVYMVRQAIQ